MSSVFLERDDAKDFGVSVFDVESVTGRRVCWIERYSEWSSDDPKSNDQVVSGLHIYLCDPDPDTKCKSCEYAGKAVT